MGRAHFKRLYRHHDPYLVIHPACDADVHAFAAKQPIHAVGRTRMGRKSLSHYAYDADNAPLLLSFFRGSGHWVCGTCRKAYLGQGPECSDLAWDDEWVHSIGMARFETVPEWERIFESVADAVGGGFGFRSARGNPVVSMAEHEKVLGITPPYDRDVVVKAFRAAVQRTHPDRPGGSAAAFQAVVDAKDALLPALG